MLALIGDSTNAVRDGRSPSEAEVARTIIDLVKAAKGRVAVTTFASNVARIKAVAAAARAADREVVVVGRAMERVVQVARETGYLDGVQNFRSPEVYGHLPQDKVLALCTGSQGEPRAALARIANDDHPEITLNRGDSVIFSSRTIPGNEKAVGSIINNLVLQGVEVLTDRDHLVHVSGHPRRDELRDMIAWTKPQLLIPVHGEALHLNEHAKLARAAGVPRVLVVRNGDLIKLGPGDPGIIGEVPVRPALQGRHDLGGFQVPRGGRASPHGFLRLRLRRGRDDGAGRACRRSRGRSGRHPREEPGRRALRRHRLRRRGVHHRGPAEGAPPRCGCAG